MTTRRYELKGAGPAPIYRIPYDTALNAAARQTLTTAPIGSGATNSAGRSPTLGGPRTLPLPRRIASATARSFGGPGTPPRPR